MFFCLVFVMPLCAYVYLCLAVTCWERADLLDLVYCGRPWPAAYINIIQNTHQIQVLTEALCRAQAIFYSLPNNEWGTKYRGLTYSAK